MLDTLYVHNVYLSSRPRSRRSSVCWSSKSTCRRYKYVCLLLVFSLLWLQWALYAGFGDWGMVWAGVEIQKVVEMPRPGYVEIGAEVLSG